MLCVLEQSGEGGTNARKVEELCLCDGDGGRFVILSMTDNEIGLISKDIEIMIVNECCEDWR